MKEQGKKQNIYDGLINGVPKFPVPLAKVVSEMAHNESSNPLPVVTDASQVDHRSVMVFDGSCDEGPGPALYTAVMNYQARCQQSVADKFKALCDYLVQQDKQASASSPVKAVDSGGSSSSITEEGGPLPDLSVALGIINGTRYEDMEGSWAWLGVVRSYAERLASSAQPLPGFPALIQACEFTYAPISFLLVPVQALCDQGLTQLADLLAFSTQNQGAAVIQNSSLFVTLSAPTDLLWVPWGVAAVPIGREPFSDKTPRTASFWCKNFFTPEESLHISHQVWTSIKLCNSQHLCSKASQKIWQKRKLVFDRFCVDRASIVLQFKTEGDTQLDDEVDVIAKDIESALKAVGTSRQQPEAAVADKPTPRARATPKRNAKAKAAAGSDRGKLGIAATKKASKPKLDK